MILSCGLLATVVRTRVLALVFCSTAFVGVGCRSAPSPLPNPSGQEYGDHPTADFSSTAPALYEDIPVPMPLPGEPGTTTRDLVVRDASRSRGSSRAAVEVLRDDRQAEFAPPDAVPSPAGIPDDALLERMQALLLEVGRYHGRSEGTLDDGDRLTKHKLVNQLINLHFLIGGHEVEYLDPLLDALENPHLPGTVHSLLRAAFYHDVGQEDLRDKMLNEWFPKNSATANSASAFRVENLRLCSRVDGYRSYTPYTDHTFEPDHTVFIYCELLNLRNLRSGDSWRRGVSVNLFLYDDTGTEADRRVLTPQAGAWESSPMRDQPNHICSAYRLPLRVKPGNYRLVVQITDLNADDSAAAEVAVKLVR